MNVSPPDWIGRLLPPDVHVVEGPLASARGELFEVELAAVSRAVDKRRNEFSAGRFFAHEAMRRAGHPVSPVPAAEDRSPVWPAGLVGSITHCDDYAAAAVARQDEVLAVGIDIDHVDRFNAPMAKAICRPAELQCWQAMSEAEGLEFLALVFCAKEALYKCQHPLTRSWLNFKDVEIAESSADGRFVVMLQKAAGDFTIGRRFEGRFGCNAGLMATALLLRP